MLLLFKNLSTELLKKTKLTFLTLAFLLSSLLSIGQNINDPYLDVKNETTSVYQATGTQYPGTGYMGEYQFYLPHDHPWSNVPDAEFSVKTECVSFPFLPVHKYHDNLTFRALGIPKSSTLEQNSKEEHFLIQDYYNPFGNKTFSSSPGFDNSENYLFTKFQGEDWYPVGWNSTIYSGFLSTLSHGTDNNTLISAIFKDPNHSFDINSDNRNLFPHSILKHTLYLRTGCNQNQIIDSLIYIVDLTRGMMVNYPFTNTALNPIGAGEPHYDIVVKFEAEVPSDYGEAGGIGISEHISPNPSYPIYDYFNPESTNWMFGSDNDCEQTIYIPNAYPSSGDYQATVGNHIKLPQYSKTGVLLLNHNLSNRAGYDNSSNTLSYINPLYEHIYKIDNAYDITYINPSEKIVYNPSEVEVDIDDLSDPLIFPSGYTFKTVLGNYPKKTDVEAADPNNYYGKDPFKIPVANTADTGPGQTTGQLGYQSTYIIKSGSKLVIEDCVTLLDVKFTVDQGGMLEFNSQALYGNATNYLITNAIANGSTFIDRNTVPTPGCNQECLATTNTQADWTNHTISTDLTLPANTIKRVFGTLTVEAGKKLTLLEGCKLEFAPNSRLIIETNGDLVTVGTTTNQVELTSMCDNMWDGIELRGASANLKYTLLENAYTGIRNFSTVDINLVSGHFQSDHVIFRNCITGLHLKNGLNTPSPNKLEYCTFETTNDLPDNRFSVNNVNKPTIIHVLDERSQGYLYSNCTFQNLNNLLKPHERGIGIKSTGGSFSAGLKNLTIVNTFKHLSVGILASQNKSHQLTVINRAFFIGNTYGVICQNASFIDISNCTFEVPVSTLPISTTFSDVSLEMYNRPTGIYMQNSSGFYIYDNEFSKAITKLTGNPICSNCNQAIVLDATTPGFEADGGNGLVMNNIFEEVNIGVLAQNGNGTETGFGSYVAGNGVSVVCNEFKDLVSYDLALTIVPSSQAQGQRPIRDQGYCANIPNHLEYDYPALNTYNPCIGQTRNVHNESASFDYYHAVNNLPNCTTNSVTMKECTYPFDDLTGNIHKCNSYFSNFDPVSLPLSGKRQQYIDKAEELTDRIVDFKLLLDGGNTVSLINTITNGTEAEAITALQDAGSYVSDEALMAAINRFGSTQVVALQQILIDNSKLSATIWSAVTSFTPAFSTEFMTALTNVQEGVSARGSYIKWIDYTAYERNTIFDGLYFADMMNDSDLTEALDVLRNDDNMYIQKKLLSLLISEGEYTEAEIVLNGIKQTDNSSLYILEQEAKLIMSRDAVGFYELPESLKDGLAQYRVDAPQQSSWSALQAGIHSWQYYINPELINTSTENNKWDGVQENTLKEDVNNSNYLTCYPNPTNSGGTIEGFAPILKKGNNQIKIYNSIGQLISSKTIAKEQFKITVQLPTKGLYFIALYQNNQLLKYQKWVVQ